MENRSVALAIVFTIITCGIYGLYWIYKIAVGFESAQTQSRVATTPGITVLLYIVTGGIYGIYAYYMWGKASTEIAERYGRMGEDKAILYLILSICGLSIINDALIQTDFNMWLSIPPSESQYRY